MFVQAKLDAVPAEATKETKKKGKEYSVDEITGERIYKSGHLKKVSSCADRIPSCPACAFALSCCALALRMLGRLR